MRRSPILIGLVLGVLVGAGGVAGIAASETGEGRPRTFVGATAQDPGWTSIGAPSIPVDIRVRGTLPDLRREARAYRIGQTPADGAVQRVAAAFGIHGPLTRDSGGWVMREGSRLVRVMQADGLPWFFSLYQGRCVFVPSEVPHAPPASPEALPRVAPPGAVSCPPESYPAPGELPRPRDLPSRDEALAEARATLGRAGLGLSKPRLTDGGYEWRIEASPLVDGRPTLGLEWNITVWPKGVITQAGGLLARPEAAETYTLIGTAAAMARLPSSIAVPMVGRPECPPEAASHCVDNRLIRTVTGVQLGYVSVRVHTAHDDDVFRDASKPPPPLGQRYLLPAYLFEFERQAPFDDPGGPPPVAAVPAIEGRYLAPRS